MFLKRFGIVVIVALLMIMLVLPVAAQQSNLVILVNDTRTLSGPGGSATDNVLRACQTFYLREVSSDGQYAHLFVTPSVSVWVSASVVQDVAENYGQRNGSPATCSGAPLAAPSATGGNPPATQSTQSVSSPATPVPTTSTNTSITPNLVLANTNTALLNVPAGDSTGLTVRTCQTYFAVEISADHQYYRLHITPSISGWISVANVQDVAENYGQRSGEARAPGC